MRLAMRHAARVAVAILLTGMGVAGPGGPVYAQSEMKPVAAASDLKRFNVTVRRFDPAKGPSTGTEFVLPVDSPDEEHAISAAMSNAIAFTKKVENGRTLPVAFICVAVSLR